MSASPTKLEHDLPPSLIADAAIVMLADCSESPQDCDAHLKAMTTAPDRLAAYLISEAKRLEAATMGSPNQNQALRARVMVRELRKDNPAAMKGLESALVMLNLDLAEWAEILAHA